jgi:predicted small lipoprotein YifL
MRRGRIALGLICCCLLLVLSACGNKGPLLQAPEKERQKTATETE